MLITYVLKPGVTGGSINPGDGSSYDLETNIAAGGGRITVDTDATPTLAAALAASDALLVSGIVPGVPSGPTGVGTGVAYNWKTPGVNTVVDLPATGNTFNDATLALDTSTLYAWNGTQWKQLAAFGGGTGLPTTLDFGTSSTSTFVSTIDGGSSSTTSFVQTIDGGHS